MFNWAKRKKWLLVNAVLIGVLVSALGIQITNTSDTLDRFIEVGVGNEKVITLGHTAFAAGSVDYTYDGTDDDVQFQAALDALPATGGRLVDVSAVQKNFSATVTRAINNVVIEGAGFGSYFTNDGVTALFTAGGNGWKFQDIRTDAGGINMGATTGWQWVNVNAGSGIVYDLRTPAGSIVNGVVTASSIDNSGSISLKPSGDSDDYVTFSTVSNIPRMIPAGATGFYIGDSVGIGDGAVTSVDGVTVPNELFSLGVVGDWTDTGNYLRRGIWDMVEMSKTDADFTGSFGGALLQANVGAANTQDWTGTYGIFGSASHVKSQLGSSGTVTWARGSWTYLAMNGGAGATNVASFYAVAPVGDITNLYQLYLEAPTVGTAYNYAIYAAGGDTYLGGSHLFTGGAAYTGLNQSVFGGDYTSSGGSNYAEKQRFAGTLTGVAGDTAKLVGTYFVNAIATQTAVESVGEVAQVYINEPLITKNVTNIPIAAALIVAAQPTEGDINASIYVTAGDIRVASGDIYLSGGVFAGGASKTNNTQNSFGGNFVSGGVSTVAEKQLFSGTLTGASGDTGWLTGTLFNNVITTQSVAETLDLATQIYVGKPTITKNVTTINKAFTMFVANTPTEGTTNAAIGIGGGDIKWLGSLDSASVADQVALGGYDLSPGNRALAISQESAVVVDTDNETAYSHYMPVRINGVSYGLMLRPLP